MTKQEIVSAFINRINAHDVDGICALMDENHIFVDGLGRSTKGREAMRQAWQSYFAVIPDYWIKVDRVLEDETVVAIFGRAGGTVAKDGRVDPANRWETPASWLAIVGSTAIALWQVFADTEPVRQIMTRTEKNKRESAGQSNIAIEIRTAKPEDSAAIQEVHSRAFAGPAEAKLVRLISERKKALISFVALSGGRVVGHILFSRVTIANSPDTFSAIGLAPVAVLPELQRQGIGSKLIREGLERSKQAGYDAVVLLGDPAYYSRFGFMRAADFGLQNEYGVHDEFMVLPLRDGALDGVSGMAKYLPEFREAEV